MPRKPTRNEKKKIKAGANTAKPGVKKRNSPAGKGPNSGAAGKANPNSPSAPTAPAGLSKLKKNSYFIFGRHAIAAALSNEDRDCLRLVGIERAFDNARDLLDIRPSVPAVLVKDEKILRHHVPADSPHQGLLLEVLPLPRKNIHDLAMDADGKRLVLVLDQVTDPQNVGACMRAGAALGASLLITQDRHCPEENGTIARTSAGALEKLPWLRAGNMASTLDDLKAAGFWVVGMDGDTDTTLRHIDSGGKIALVMGSEGKGMRPLTRKHCDIIAKIPMTDQVESLNVATAAAIAIYELGKLEC